MGSLKVGFGSSIKHALLMVEFQSFLDAAKYIFKYHKLEYYFEMEY